MNVRLATPDDAARVNAFHRRISGVERTEAQWRWLFGEHPLSDGTLPYAIAEEGDRVVATNGLIPLRLVDAHGAYWTGKSEDSLVDPDYRGRDLLRALFDALRECAAGLEATCIWGFTAVPRPFVRIGFEPALETAQLFRTLRARGLRDVLEDDAGEAAAAGGARTLRLESAGLGAAALGRIVEAFGRSRPRAADHLELETLDAAPEEGGALCNAFVKRWGGATLLRDRSFLDWRFFRNPHLRAILIGARHRGRLVGLVAFAVDPAGHGFVVDLVAADPAAEPRHDAAIVRALFFEATRRVRAMGASNARAWSVGAHAYERILRREARRCGYIRVARGHPLLVLPMTGAARRADPARDWWITRAWTQGLSG